LKKEGQREQKNEWNVTHKKKTPPHQPLATLSFENFMKKAKKFVPCQKIFFPSRPLFFQVSLLLDGKSNIKRNKKNCSFATDSFINLTSE
jgi:hypothetical protein